MPEDEGRPPRQVGARAAGRRLGARRREGHRPQARRAGRARALERPRPGSAAAAHGRRGDRDPHDAQPRRPGRAVRAPPLGGAPAGRGGAAALSGREDRHRPADRERLLLRLRVPRADPRVRPGADRGGDPPRARRGTRVEPRGDRTRRGPRALLRRGRAVQGRARRHGRGRHLALHAGRVHRPLPRPAPAGLEADQGGQADRPRRRVLARGREEHAADADLRHRLLLAGGSRRVPRAAGGGEAPRPPPARPAARPLPPRRQRSWHAVLAPEGDGALEPPRGPAAAREREARLRRGEDAADVRHRRLDHVGPLGEVPRRHVPRARTARTGRSVSSR